MHSVDDKTAAPNSMEKIYNQIGSQDKSMLWIQDSGHVITREPSRDLVYHEAQYFIERVTQSK
jgi:esterase/lipase